MIFLQAPYGCSCSAPTSNKKREISKPISKKPLIMEIYEMELDKRFIEAKKQQEDNERRNRQRGKLSDLLKKQRDNIY